MEIDIDDIICEFNESLQYNDLQALLIQDVLTESVSIKIGVPGFAEKGGDYLQVKSLTVNADNIDDQYELMVVKLYKTQANENFYSYLHDIRSQLKQEANDDIDF